MQKDLVWAVVQTIHRVLGVTKHSVKNERHAVNQILCFVVGECFRRKSVKQVRHQADRPRNTQEEIEVLAGILRQNRAEIRLLAVGQARDFHPTFAEPEEDSKGKRADQDPVGGNQRERGASCQHSQNETECNRKNVQQDLLFEPDAVQHRVQKVCDADERNHSREMDRCRSAQADQQKGESKRGGNRNLSRGDRALLFPRVGRIGMPVENIIQNITGTRPHAKSRESRAA